MNQSMNGAIEAKYFPDVALTEAEERRLQGAPPNRKDLLNRNMAEISTPPQRIAAAVIDELMAQEA